MITFEDFAALLDEMTPDQLWSISAIAQRELLEKEFERV